MVNHHVIFVDVGDYIEYNAPTKIAAFEYKLEHTIKQLRDELAHHLGKRMCFISA